MSCLRDYCSYVQESVMNDFHIVRSLGKGAFADVELVELGTGQQVAIKKMKTDFTETNSGPSTETLREVETLIRLKACPNVIYMYGVCSSTGASESCLTTDIVLEVFDTNLHDYTNSTPFNIRMTKFDEILVAMIRAKAYMEALELCHNDIKLDNILYRASDNTFKLADFGLSRFAFEPIDRIFFTVTYRPIEIFIQRQTQPMLKFDIWALGVTLLLYIVGRHPFYEDSIEGLLDKIRFWTRPDLDLESFLLIAHSSNTEKVNVSKIFELGLDATARSMIPPGTSDLLSRMLSIDPNQRPLASQIASERGITVSLPSTGPLPSHPKETNQEIDGILNRMAPNELSRRLVKDLFSQIYYSSLKGPLYIYTASIVATCRIAFTYLNIPVTLADIIDSYYITTGSDVRYNRLMGIDCDTTIKVLLKFLNYVIVSNPDILKLYRV